MKAKITEYRGVFFRSRLEVKWCKFFEVLGVRFEYEPKATKTTLGGYIPDFYFRSLKTWVEIKGVSPTGDELKKIIDVCVSTNKAGLIISGYPKAFPDGCDPHLANCTCYFITNKGNTLQLSADELYQIIKNIKILYEVSRHTKSDGLMSLNFSEYFRVKNIEAAQAKFKPVKKTYINDLKKLTKTLAILNNRLNK